jgi:translation initiation factor IF-1
LETGPPLRRIGAQITPLENEHEIIARTAEKMRKNQIRVLAGDKVLVE